MRFYFPIIAISLFTASACSASTPVDDAELGVAATEYSIEIAKARYIQRKCPALMMSFDGMMRELRSQPVLAQSGGKMTEDMVDKARVLAAIDRFEAENGLRGASREAICEFGKHQIAEGTRTGGLLAFRTQ
jgi:hypothetical protein